MWAKYEIYFEVIIILKVGDDGEFTFKLKSE